jgi:hypothetical protein
MSQKYESYKPSACTYNSLDQYFGDRSVLAPLPETSMNNSGSYLIPNYKPITYDTLINRPGMTPNCSGYYNIGSAYGADADNCSTQFEKRKCVNKKENYNACTHCWNMSVSENFPKDIVEKCFVDYDCHGKPREF